MWALLSEIHLTPHVRFFIPNYHFYRTDRFPGREGGTAVAVRIGTRHKYVDLLLLASRETTEVCIPIGNSKVLLAALCKSPCRAWNDADIIELLMLRLDFLNLFALEETLK
jgi:hypothetical protein